MFEPNIKVYLVSDLSIYLEENHKRVDLSFIMKVRDNLNKTNKSIEQMDRID